MEFPKGSIQEPAKLRWEIGDREVRFTIVRGDGAFFSFTLNEESMMDLMIAWMQNVPPPSLPEEDVHNAV